MGWDDDDDDDEWDVDDIEARAEELRKEKERAKRIEEGLESESEEEKPQPKAGAAPKPKPKPKPKKAPAPAPESEVLLDPVAEKLRKQKLVEEADARLAQDLFSGCGSSPTAEDAARAERERAEREEQQRRQAAKPKIIVVDAFDRVELKVQADVERLSDTCLTKVNKSQAKGVAAKFLVDTLKQLEGNLDMKELGELDKAITELVKEKKVQKGTVDAKANKANTKLSKTTKFNASSEWEEYYGGGEGDEEWTQEEWDEWNKTQAAAK